MDRSKDQPTTSRRQVVGGTNNEPASRRKKTEEKVTKGGNRTIMGPRGLQTVPVNPGDVIVTITRRDGTKTQNVDHRKTTASNKTSTKTLVKTTTTKQNTQSQQVGSQNKQPAVSNSSVQSTQQEQNSSNSMTPYDFWYRQNFIKAYVQAYKNNDPNLSWYNYQLKNLKDPEGVWKEIWPQLSPYNTPEKSALDHYYLWNNKGVGATNWSNIYGGNTQQAEWRDENGWLGLENVPQAARDWSLSSDNRSEAPQIDVDTIIQNNLDKFKNQYVYANTYQGTFNYDPDQFDNTGLNVNNRYGGIGDFMNTYNLTPQQLYDILKKYY